MSRATWVAAAVVGLIVAVVFVWGALARLTGVQ